jgi:hypothetical protein
MNLLLAEDDAIARMTLSAVLTGLGYEVTDGYCPDCYEKHVRPQIEGR